MNDTNKAANEAPRIYRQIAFDLQSFDRLKEEQRKLQAQLGRRVTNAEALCNLIQRTPK